MFSDCYVDYCNPPLHHQTKHKGVTHTEEQTEEESEKTTYFEIMLFSFSMMTRATIKMIEMVYLMRILVCNCVQWVIHSQIIPSSFSSGWTLK